MVKNGRKRLIGRGDRQAVSYGQNLQKGQQSKQYSSTRTSQLQSFKGTMRKNTLTVFDCWHCYLVHARGHF